ncbi:MAG: FAD:protein FMN transferase [Paracoccaceae bacterium]
MLRTLSGPAMGSRWSVRLACDDALADLITIACSAAIERVEAQMSNWRADSDLSRLNAAPVGDWVMLPAELLFVLQQALDIGRASDGLFDIGVGAMVQAWGFGPAKGATDLAEISAHLGKSLRSFEVLDLDLDGLRARKAIALVADLSGIAKGYGVDVLAQVVRDHGVANFLCGLDGELVGAGVRPDDRPWAVALEEPDATRRSGRAMIELSDQAIATSGGYRHFVTLGNLRVSHTMNPRTGGPAVSPLVSVTVLHQTCMLADAWATVLMVLGDVAGPEFARAHHLQAIFLSSIGGKTTETLVGFKS